jgi:hypothetical protein
MDKIVSGRFDDHLAEVQRKKEGRPVNQIPQARRLDRASIQRGRGDGISHEKGDRNGLAPRLVPTCPV